VNYIAGPIHLWVRLYTLGLDRVTADERWAELESDLWEQLRSESEQGSERARVAASIWARWLLRIPDDLIWRAEHVAISRGHRSSERRSKMDTVTSRNKLYGLGVVVAAIVAVAIGVMTIDNIQYFDRSDHIIATSTLNTLELALLVAGLGAIALGFFVMGARPAEGATLAVGGSLTAAIMTYWLLIPLLLAVAISVYAVRRARRIAGSTPRA